MYVPFRKYKTTKKRRKKMTKLKSARYICGGEISSTDPSSKCSLSSLVKGLRKIATSIAKDCNFLSNFDFKLQVSVDFASVLVIFKKRFYEVDR